MCGLRCTGAIRRCDCKSDDFLFDVELLRFWGFPEPVERLNELDYIVTSERMN